MSEAGDDVVSGKYLSNWVSREDIVEGGDSARILGRLEGYMRSGAVVSSDDLNKILEECGFSVVEACDLGKAQMEGIRKGLDLQYNTVGEFWEAHAERLGNVPAILEYRERRFGDE